MPISCINFSNRHCERTRSNPSRRALGKMDCRVALLLAMTGISAAHADTATLPAELMNNGAPVEALCFENVSADEWLDVNQCVTGDIVKVPAKPEDAWAKDLLGYRYRYKQDTSDAQSYSFYQYVGQWNGSPVIVSYGSGGGTGQFTSLMSIERAGAKVRVLQGFAAGDRCNGGISDAKIEGGTLKYGQNMTPIDFLQIADDNPNDVQPYEDLEASAASCFAVARFEDEKLTGVSLLPLPADASDTAPYKYQACFNKLYNALLASGKKELSVKELKEFTKNFNEQCVAAPVPTQ